MIKFYYAPRSSASRCHIALEEVGVPYEKVRVHLDKGEQKTPEFLAINPNGKVPALVDGHVKIFESLAILAYLGVKYGADKDMWPTPGSSEHWDAMSWSIWAGAELSPAVMDTVVHTCDVSWALPAEQRSTHVADAAKATWARCLSILDKRLEGRDFMMGRGFTLVDTAVGLTVGMGAMFAQLPFESKNVEAWIGRLQSRPSFAKVMGEE
jgi:glutathione S-transferase